MKNLQFEKITIGYCESVKKGGYFEPLEEVWVDELSTKEFKKAVADDRWLFDRIINNCLDLYLNADNVVCACDIVYYEINISFEKFDSVEDDYVVVDEKTLGYHIYKNFILNNDRVKELYYQYKEQAIKEFCTKNKIDYEQANKEICKLDYIEDEANKKGITLSNYQIHYIFDELVDELRDKMFKSFVHEINL